jgi:hypothetical protein
LDSWFKSYGVLKISALLWACSQPLSMQQILPKTAKIYPKTKLWNTTKNRDFNVFQKDKFRHVEEALEHVSTVWIFNPKFFHMLFLLSKNGLCMWILAYLPCGNWWFSQGSTPCVGMRFYGHIPNSPRYRNPKRHISYLLEKVVFLNPKRLLSPLDKGDKYFSFNFKCFYLANGKEWGCDIWKAYRHRS